MTDTLSSHDTDLQALIAKGHHDGLCENCEQPIPMPGTVEGNLGWYCSDECLADAEDYDGLPDVALRAWERRQMGIV
jgi:hypothetical protein